MDKGLDDIYDKIHEKICQRPLEQAYVRAEFEHLKVKEFFKKSELNGMFSWRVIVNDKKSNAFSTDGFSFYELSRMIKDNSYGNTPMEEIRIVMAFKINKCIDKVLELRNRKKGDNDE